MASALGRVGYSGGVAPHPIMPCLRPGNPISPTDQFGFHPCQGYHSVYYVADEAVNGPEPPTAKGKGMEGGCEHELGPATKPEPSPKMSPKPAVADKMDDVGIELQ